MLTGGDVDAIAGLLHLRERHRLTIYAPMRVLAILAENRIFDVLAPDCVTRTPLPLDCKLPLAGHAHNSGLSVEAYAVPGEPPLYLEGEEFDPTPREDGDVIGLSITETATGKAFRFITGRAAMTDRLQRRLARSDLVS